MKKFIAVLTATAMMAVPMCVNASTIPSPSAKAVAATASTTQETTTVADSSVEAAADAANLSVPEYVNNTILASAGVEGAAQVGQGGKIVVNGVATNMTITLSKVKDATAAKASLAENEKLVALFKANLPVGISGSNVNANFYVKGLTATDNVKVYMLVKGQWVELTVTEIRADHVLVNLTQSGVIKIVRVQ